MKNTGYAIHLPFIQGRWREIYLDPGQTEICLTVHANVQTRVEFSITAEPHEYTPSSAEEAADELDSHFSYAPDDPRK